MRLRFFLACLLLLWLLPETVFGWTIKYDLYFRRWGSYYMPFEDHGWFKSQAIAESGLDPEAVSWAGAMGLMQLMPLTAKELGVRNPWDPESNIQGGIKYDRTVDRFFKDVPFPERRKFMFAGYNAGMGNIRKARVLADSDFWEDVVDALPRVTGRHATETIGYVSRIYRLKGGL